MTLTFFIIEPEADSALLWAKKYWDTYGFDFDISRTHSTVFAWALTTDEELRKALQDDAIEYETFEADPDTVFAC